MAGNLMEIGGFITEATNNQWAPVQIYKIIGVYKDGVS